jgi:hypothetical protein
MTGNASRFTLFPVLLALVSCQTHPSAIALSTMFKQHRIELLQLITMSQEDSEYRKLPSHNLGPHDMSSHRVSEYLEIFKSIGLSGPIFRHSQYPTATFIYVQTWITLHDNLRQPDLYTLLRPPFLL